MEAKELMIGDWVEMNLSPSTSQQYYFKSKIVVSNLVSLENGYDFDAKPIPLSEEILVSNGFKNVGKYEWQDEMYVTRYRYRDKEADKLFDINYTPDYDGFNVKGFNVNEVHKLQHLLRLANLNELADNFKIE